MGKKSKEHNKKIQNRNARLKAEAAGLKKMQEKLFQQFIHQVQNEKEAAEAKQKAILEASGNVTSDITVVEPEEVKSENP